MIKHIPNFNALVERYKSGVSMLDLSNETGIHRTRLTNSFKRNNIPLRGNSEAIKLKWTQMSEDERALQYKAAHEACKGREVTTNERIKRAMACYKTKHKSGDIEVELAKLIGRFYKIEHQYPTHIYNLDLSVPDIKIAIEVQTSGLQLLKEPHIETRSEYLCKNGWFLIYVLIDQSSKPVNVQKIANAIINYANTPEDERVFEYGTYGMIGKDGLSFNSNRYNFANLERVF